MIAAVKRGEYGSDRTWITGCQEEGELFVLDTDLSLLKKIGDKVGPRLVAAGVDTIGSLGAMTDQQLRDLASQTSGASFEKLTEARDHAQTAKPGAAPIGFNHRLEEHPFKSRYGEEIVQGNWAMLPQW